MSALRDGSEVHALALPVLSAKPQAGVTMERYLYVGRPGYFLGVYVHWFHVAVLYLVHLQALV